jgi:hypothetical protein
MTISTGDLIRSQNPGNAQSIIQSFINGYLASTNANSPNNSLVFYTGSYPTRTVPTAYRASADAVYAGLGLFTGIGNRVSNVISDSNIANVSNNTIFANTGVTLTYGNNAAQAITTGNTYTGFSQIFFRELQRYLIYRNIYASTSITGNMYPANVPFIDQGKGLIDPSFSGAGVTNWNGGAIDPNAITNPAGNANLATDSAVSADTNGIIGGEDATAFNTYWSQLMTNWVAAYSGTGTISITTTLCHSSCHSSCHGSRGRR